MGMKLDIYCKGSDTNVRCSVEKWTFRDKYMGEQSVTFDVSSPTIIPWEVGDYCIFRGQTYTLNYVPSCRQTARMYDAGNAFVYEGVTFNPPSDELTRCIILDVVPTTGDYDQYKGTNYTGSAVFTLYCGEATWEGRTYAPVHALADRIKANLDRLYPDAGWQIYVNDEACHSDDYTLSFNNWTALQALGEVHNTFKCDYAIIGRSIYIGYSLPELTSTQDGPVGQASPESVFYFGYGKGYPTSEGEDGTALFELKKVADPNQNIITRLRAYGSTRNLPYRYYMQRYNLPQTMYVHNLQLPDTFIPYSEESDPDGLYERHKTDGNATRGAVYGSGVIRHVLGETNDAYIDKNDDAENCEEGIREGIGAWDGSQSDLEEIYPTIQGMTYGELRASDVPDVLDITGKDAYKSGGAASPYYQDSERIDELLGIEDDANIGDGIVPLGKLSGRGYTFNVDNVSGTVQAPFSIEEILLDQISDIQYAGDYMLSPTLDNVTLHGVFSTASALPSQVNVSMSYQIRIVAIADASGEETEIARYSSASNLGVLSATHNQVAIDIPVVAIPDLEVEKDGKKPKVSQIHVSEASRIKIFLKIKASGLNIPLGHVVDFSYSITHPSEADEANLIWSPVDEQSEADKNFHVHLKELGFDLSQAKTIEDGAIQITMKTGMCVGRTFDVVDVEEYTDSSTGKRGWRVELERVSDDTIHVYYPNAQNTLMAGDRYVLTNIELPDAYIKAAEVRLLRAATDYLADNCETKYTHEVSVSEIYIQQNYENALENGEEEKSILWRLYAGLKFPFRGIPESIEEQDPLPILNITISSVEIKIGEADVPKVSIQLNDDVEQSTINKLTVAVDRLYNAVSGYAGNGVTSASAAMFYELLKTEGAKRFLSKLHDDTANGRLHLADGLDTGNFVAGQSGAEINATGDAEVNTAIVRGSTALRGDVTFGHAPLDKDFSGGGVYEDENGNVHLEADYLKIHKKATFAEVEIQQTSYIGGRVVNSPANGFTVTEVVPVDTSGNVITKRDYTQDGNGFPYNLPFVFGNFKVVPDFDSQSVTRYRLYFNDIDEDTGKQANMTWAVGDQAMCQTFNVTAANGGVGSRYWFRLVKAVAKNNDATDEEHYGHWYIEVDKDDCDTGSDVPEVGDKVVMLGNRNNTERQGAIIMTSAGSGSDTSVPYIRIYRHISGYNLGNAEKVLEMSKDEFYVRAESLTMLIGQDDVRTFQDVLDDLVSQISDVADQMDESFKVWQGTTTDTPTLQNYPASGWGTQSEPYSEHVGDFYFTSNGLCYRFTWNKNESNPVYSWVQVTDQGIINYALQISDKKRVFVSQPTKSAAYDIGDLWVNAVYPSSGASQGSIANNVILVCKRAKVPGEDFNIAHWQAASTELDQFVQNVLPDAISEAIAEQEDKQVVSYFSEKAVNFPTWDNADSEHVGDTWYIKYIADGDAGDPASPSDKNLPHSLEEEYEESDLLVVWAKIESNGTTTYNWIVSQDEVTWQSMRIAYTAKDTADGKRKVFVSEPTTPYDVGDLWVQGANGDLLRCINKRETGDYQASDWGIGTKYTGDENLNTFIQTVYNPTIAGIEDQLDGVIETHFNRGAPTLNNAPAVDWNTTDLKEAHLGDMYYDNDSGIGYRFSKDEGVYKWVEVGDSGVAQALAAAAAAQDTADGKRRVFVGTSNPKPPYDEGDLWAAGSEGDLKRCQIPKEKNESFSASDWVLATKYTDDTAANEALQQLDDMANDGILTRQEKPRVADEWSRISAEYAAEQEKLQIYEDDHADIYTEVLEMYDLPSNYGDARDALYEYLFNNTNGVLKSMSTDTTLPSATIGSTEYTGAQLFAKRFKDYYDAFNALENAFTEAAQLSAEKSLTALNRIDDDGYLTLTEKKFLESQWGTGAISNSQYVPTTKGSLTVIHETLVTTANLYAINSNTSERYSVDGANLQYKTIYDRFCQSYLMLMTAWANYWSQITEDTLLSTFSSYNVGRLHSGASYMYADNMDGLFTLYYHYKNAIENVLDTKVKSETDANKTDIATLNTWTTTGAGGQGIASWNNFVGTFDKTKDANNNDIFIPKEAGGVRMGMTNTGLDLYYKDGSGNYQKATMGMSVQNGKAYAEIQADQINLEGVTTINDGFKVNLDGSFEANRGTMSGLITNRPTFVTALNAASVTSIRRDWHTGQIACFIDVETLGREVIFYVSPADSDNRTIGNTGVRRFPIGYNAFNSGDAIYAHESVTIAYRESSAEYTGPELFGYMNNTWNYDVQGMYVDLPHYPSLYLDLYGSSYVSFLSLATSEEKEGLYREYLGKEVLSSSEETTANTSTTTGAWPIYRELRLAQIFGERVRKAREMVGSRITIRGYGNATTDNAFYSTKFYGIATQTTGTKNGDTVSYWHFPDGNEAGYTVSEIYDVIGGNGNVLTLECRELMDIDDNIFVGWVASASTESYYDRYTLGLEDNV